jgi:hypothetical protein
MTPPVYRLEIFGLIASSDVTGNVMVYVDVFSVLIWVKGHFTNGADTTLVYEQ